MTAPFEMPPSHADRLVRARQVARFATLVLAGCPVNEIDLDENLPEVRVRRPVVGTVRGVEWRPLVVLREITAPETDEKVLAPMTLPRPVLDVAPTVCPRCGRTAPVDPFVDRCPGMLQESTLLRMLIPSEELHADPE